MRLFSLFAAGIFAVSSTASAQDATPKPTVETSAESPSSTGGSQSSGQGNGSAPVPATKPAEAGDDAAKAKSPSLPVSLDHIREGLKRQATDSLLKRTDIPVDFRIQIIEQQKIDSMLSKLDFKSGVGPIPAGGIYAYEQQRRLFNPVDHPLAQPYSAFSGGEFFTIALENLLARYLGRPVLDHLTDAERARAEREAREEVARDIDAYCAQRPDRARIEICTRPFLR
jgi:hypothetical protein